MADTHPITTFDQLVQLLDSVEGNYVVVEAGVEDSMSGLEGVTAKGVLKRRRGGPYDDEPGLPRSPRYDLYHHGRSVGDFNVDELYFTAAELLVFDTGQDCPRLFITQEVWRLSREGDLPPHRLQLVVWFEEHLTFDLPVRDSEEVTS